MSSANEASFDSLPIWYANSNFKAKIRLADYEDHFSNLPIKKSSEDTYIHLRKVGEKPLGSCGTRLRLSHAKSQKESNYQKRHLALGFLFLPLNQILSLIFFSFRKLVQLLVRVEVVGEFSFSFPHVHSPLVLTHFLSVQIIATI